MVLASLRWKNLEHWGYTKDKIVALKIIGLKIVTVWG